ncbi:polyprenyl synthetase family protein [Streptomyces sp. XD-27]|uniref:polyprenyl synthetase family protein n=1 Tax=Streptomyces sp. XD-27 TaxID=3062779 RepID=UPI0026F42CFA|nr:polyprenyl synthetase family protein [Streptomyces sp. XD-27]WKX70387.1 polyprenyl synthetase family protein [Streptomyces sp. XD-27]
MVSFAKPAHRDSLTTDLALGDPDLEARLAHGLEASESRLRGCAAELRDPYAAQAAGRLVQADGTRLHPLLALIGAEFSDCDTESAVKAAVLAGLLHGTSPFHDYVMAGAGTWPGAGARGPRVPHARARGEGTVRACAGDRLLRKAASVAAELGPEVVRLQARMADRLAVSQMRELVGPMDGEDPLAHYTEVTAGKSAALASMALQLCAVRAGATGSGTRAALAAYGEQLGIALRMSDDLVDGAVGMPAGGAGVAGLPAVIALADRRRETEELRTLLSAPPGTAGSGGPTGPTGRADSGGQTGPRDVARISDLLHSTGAVAEARAMTYARLARARAALEGLPEGPATAALHALCDLVGRRDH